MYYSQSRFEQALTCLEEALEIRIHSLGENHLKVARVLMNLSVSTKTGNEDKARIANARAQAILQRHGLRM